MEKKFCITANSHAKRMTTNNHKVCVVEEMDVAEGDESADAVVDPEQGESAATIVVTESVALVLDGGENSETNVPTMDIEAVEKVEIPGGVEENAADTGT